MKSLASLETLYPLLPVAMQNMACGYYGRKEMRKRFDKTFERYLEELSLSEFWSARQIEEFQTEKVCAVVRHAYETVPYYRDLMKKEKLTPDDIRSIPDLQKLPILTKEAVRSNLDRLVSETADRKDLLYQHTSGTTGKSLHFYKNRSAIAFQWAIWWRHRGRFGLRRGDMHANFTGKMVVPPSQNQPPFWRWNRPQNQALINMHHLTPDKIGAVVDFLGEHDFKYYSGYPSIIHALAMIAREQGLTLKTGPGFVITGAENVLDYQRRDIAEFTGAVLTDQYGFSEGCGNASHCPEFVYHEDFEFGIMECVDPVSVNDRTQGKIVCTGFSSMGFPLIRYEVGDVGTWEDPSISCACGRHTKILVGIEGREDDYVVTPEGRRIMRFDYVFKETHHIRESQVVQAVPGEIIVRIARRPEYTAADEAFLTSEIHRWISPKLLIKYEYVDEIERESNGKFRAVKRIKTL